MKINKIKRKDELEKKMNAEGDLISSSKSTLKNSQVYQGLITFYGDILSMNPTRLTNQLFIYWMYRKFKTP